MTPEQYLHPCASPGALTAPMPSSQSPPNPEAPSAEGAESWQSPEELTAGSPCSSEDIAEADKPAGGPQENSNRIFCATSECLYIFLVT